MKQSRIRELYIQVGSERESSRYLALIELLNHLAMETLEDMVKTLDKDELLRLQGGARIIKALITSLSRKSIGEQRTGGFE